MYFLNGIRKFIKPENNSGSFGKQLQNCIKQLNGINSDGRVFKLNFFVESKSYDHYKEIQEEIVQKIKMDFNKEIILNFIAQPPLTCKIIIEAFFYNSDLWDTELISHPKANAIHFTCEGTEFIIGNVQVNNKLPRVEQSEMAFISLKEVLGKKDFHLGSIIRQWNYIEGINGFDGNNSHYQDFNNVRSKFYGNEFEQGGYPAATGIGMNEGGIIIEFIALRSDQAKTNPVNNPLQIAPHQYSKKILVGENRSNKTTPKFERARYLELSNKIMLFISGTASIKGEKTVGIGDPAEQAEVTIQNIKQLYSSAALKQAGISETIQKIGHARIYIKDKNDFTVIKKVFEIHYGDLPVVYIQADICRPDLLVEIEGNVILN